MDGRDVVVTSTGLADAATSQFLHQDVVWEDKVHHLVDMRNLFPAPV